MEKDKTERGFFPLSEMISKIVDPILRRRAGFNIQLLENWSEIVGADVAEATRPLKIIWPHRMTADDIFEPAILVIACEGFSAIRLQHESSEVIQRINTFFGFAAIARLKIKQEPVRSAKQFSKQPLILDEKQKKCLEQLVADIQDEELRLALFNLGKGILGDKDRKQNRSYIKNLNPNSLHE
ncbi:MAG: hypothetical protein JSC189_001344 [Candidatus Tokpelaia sp. JSC189]|nr:MAG: hypothetical protein JSC189_001344 [Candidatus Tokpelaia sp. JSC189]